MLEKAGAAWVIRQETLSAEGFARKLTEILAHPDMLSVYARAARELGHPDAATRLADLAECLTEGGAA